MRIVAVLILSLMYLFSSCEEHKESENTDKTAQNVSTDLQVDHFNIWVKNPKKAKQLIVDLGFTSIPDSLSAIHHGQGTAGRYFYFLNSYLELIFVNDQEEFEQNAESNKDLDFRERSNFASNGASPFGLALNVKDYDVSKIPFGKIEYHQSWMDENASIYVAKTSKTHLKAPSIFVVYPEITYDVFETISDLSTIPEEYAIWREFYKHPNGAEKITDIQITSVDADLGTESMKTVNEIENLTVKNGVEHLIKVYFDNNVQGKSFDLRPELPLIIYL